MLVLERLQFSLCSSTCAYGDKFDAASEQQAQAPFSSHRLRVTCVIRVLRLAAAPHFTCTHRQANVTVPFVEGFVPSREPACKTCAPKLMTTL